MDDKQYIQNAVKTAAAPMNFAKRFDLGRVNALKTELTDFIDQADVLDQYKKHLIYGKDNSINRHQDPINEIKFTDQRLNLIHGILGIATEAGELAQIIKSDSEVDQVNLQEEIGDIMWYIALICDTYQFDLAEIKRKNIEKLAKRYPNLFTEQDANNRNLKDEREVLEK